MSLDWQPTEMGRIARKLLRSSDCGILSTMSVENPGYPFGSITPYVMTHGGRVAIYVSGIAQHTHNMRENDKVCLTVTDDGNGNKQDQGRATVMGDARPVPEEFLDAVSGRYFEFFPDARHYGSAHSFTFFWIDPLRVRYIGGFGKIFWVEEKEWSVPDPEWASTESGIIKHMNDDHRDALLAMTRFFGGIDAREVSLVAVDPEGCHIRADGRIHYVAFEEPAMNAETVRKAMVALTVASRVS